MFNKLTNIPILYTTNKYGSLPRHAIDHLQKLSQQLINESRQLPMILIIANAVVDTPIVQLAGRVYELVKPFSIVEKPEILGVQ